MVNDDKQDFTKIRPKPRTLSRKPDKNIKNEESKSNIGLSKLELFTDPNASVANI
jgi:hypothetical protein